MSGGRKFGTLNPVIFFRCKSGHIVLAPYSECPTPSACEFQAPITSHICGQPCERDGADTLVAIDRLQHSLSSQENQKHSIEQHFDTMQTEPGRQRVHDSLYSRLVSSATPEMEKDFIREYLRLRPELRGKHHAKFAAYSVYVHAREFDIGKRDESKEQNP